MKACRVGGHTLVFGDKIPRNVTVQAMSTSWMSTWRVRSINRKVRVLQRIPAEKSSRLPENPKVPRSTP